MFRPGSRRRGAPPALSWQLPGQMAPGQAGALLSAWQVLRQFSINLSEEEFFHILEYYDKTLSSQIPYNDFLRAFLQ